MLSAFPPVPKYSTFTYIGENEVEYLCGICQDPLMVPVTSECEHVFCSDCIKPWLSNHNSCPTCRSTVSCSKLVTLRPFLNVLDKILIECDSCHEQMERGKFQQHKGQCSVSCPLECGVTISRDSWFDHASCCSSFITAVDGSEYPDISYCGNKIQWIRGKGIVCFSNGVRQESSWEDSKPIGSVVIASAAATWTGECTDDLCITTFINSETGSLYIGEWKNGLRHGKGIFVAKSGNTYSGQWQNDKLHGYGCYSYRSGDCYEGEWQNNLYHGKGVFRHADGTRKKRTWIAGVQKKCLKDFIREKLLPTLSRIVHLL
jgi:hypothetical protein